MIRLIENTFFEKTQDFVTVSFNHPFAVLSSAVFNGGFVLSERISNVKVSDNTGTPCFSNYNQQFGWDKNTVGLMTAAPMNSLSIATHISEDFEMSVLVTSGLTNARRAGDEADYKKLCTNEYKAGTINTVLITNLSFTQAAMAEALMIATEAKVLAVQKNGTISPISLEPATGTGTDANVIACKTGTNKIDFCGKHTLLGETIAKLVIEATYTSLRIGP